MNAFCICFAIWTAPGLSKESGAAVFPAVPEKRSRWSRRDAAQPARHLRIPARPPPPLKRVRNCAIWIYQFRREIQIKTVEPGRLLNAEPHAEPVRAGEGEAAPRRSHGSKGMEGEGGQHEQRPSSTRNGFRWHPGDGDGRSSRNGAGLGHWEAQVGVSCCLPPCISPEMSQKGGLVYLI